MSSILSSLGSIMGMYTIVKNANISCLEAKFLHHLTLAKAEAHAIYSNSSGRPPQQPEQQHKVIEIDFEFSEKMSSCTKLSEAPKVH